MTAGVRMKIYSINRSCDLIKANVVETFETSTVDLAHAMIRYQKFLLPAHKHILPIGTVLVVEVRLFGLFC